MDAKMDDRTFRDRVNSRDVLIGDGAIGTELQKRGLPIGNISETWSVDRPEDVRQVAEDYVRSGSDFVLTNTFGGNRARLRSAGLEDRVELVNRRSVILARSAAKGRHILASIGPTGGNRADDAYQDIYREQVKALCAESVDGFYVETVCSSVEGLAAVRSIREVSDLPIILSFTLTRDRVDLVMLSGELFMDACGQVEKEGADAIGVNCVGWGLVQASVKLIRQVCDLPIAISPNAGVPTRIEEGMSYPDPEEDLATRVAGLASEEVRFLGGCCGTGPAYIKQLRSLTGR